jgi:hypothetical protein
MAARRQNRAPLIAHARSRIDRGLRIERPDCFGIARPASASFRGCREHRSSRRRQTSSASFRPGSTAGNGGAVLRVPTLGRRVRHRVRPNVVRKSLAEVRRSVVAQEASARDRSRLEGYAPRTRPLTLEQHTAWNAVRPCSTGVMRSAPACCFARRAAPSSRGTGSLLLGS